jgi:DNA-binding CsgD family transcriptional regulator
MIRLGVSCAELVVRGEDYRPDLADGMQQILDVDAGIGIAQWDLGNDEITPETLMTVAGTPPLTVESAKAALAVVPKHPLLSRPDFAFTGATRVSDLTCLEAFWEQPAWELVHGINDGRYPAMTSLGWHSDRIIFVGAQRRRVDFSDDDMEVLDAIREPLISALAFRSALDRATRRLQRLRVVDNPEHDDGHGEVAAVDAAESGSVADRLASIHLLPDPCATATAAPLTQREREVLALVAAGWTNLRVGRLLGITERTVRKHLGNVYDKLAVSGRTSAATWWVSQNLS